VWRAAMWDKEFIYILARWHDQTPMNHPGSSKGDYGFNGDCLQVRFLTAPDIFAPEIVNIDRNAKDAEKMRTSHWDCWRDRDGIETIGGCYGRHFNEGGPGDAKAQGAAQAFKKNEDGKGYIQEIRLPWRLICKEGVTPAPGWKFLMTFEPNFTIGSAGRLTIKDCFRAGVGIDRVFTFSNSGCWGVATLSAKGGLQPRPVRLSDGREFAVRLENNLPAVDWTGLVKSRLPDGFKAIKFSIPKDGYVSLNIFRPDGTVARQLLASAFFAKGEHEVKWDGLSTMSVRQPGQPLPPGEYAWSGIWHTGVGLRLRGVACTAGSGLGDWGGDHGDPVACASDGERIYLGWGGAEGGKALVAVDPSGNVKWRNLRGGIGSASLVAVDSGTVYALNLIGQYAPVAIYRVSAQEGRYTEWESVKSTDLLCAKIWEEMGEDKDKAKPPTAMAAAEGKVILAYGEVGIAVLDGKSGAVLKKHPLPKVSAVAAAGQGKAYVAHDKDNASLISRLNLETGALEAFAARAAADKGWVSCLAVDAEGSVYAGIREGNMQIEVYGQDGKLSRTIGRKGGRPLLGPWQPDGVLNPSALAIDKQGQLWVAENDGWPRRFSVWDAKTGAFKAEYFGAASYGATGGAIDPTDPYRMVGQGCEWRIDPKTGGAVCLGVITRDGMAASRYGLGPDGKRLYLAVTPGFLHGAHPIRIFERLGDGRWKLRTVLRPHEVKGEDGKSKGLSAEIWADANDDGQEQAEEVRAYDVILGGWFQGWYMSMSQDLTFWGTLYRCLLYTS
ncbi:MAG: hypothetical protein N3A66_04885, partial [Planctomycetota bacterium]|nr:hypothetical protein [Planctomycetota bacterium]